jgi:hypothetical protein
MILVQNKKTTRVNEWSVFFSLVAVTCLTAKDQAGTIHRIIGKAPYLFKSIAASFAK